MHENSSRSLLRRYFLIGILGFSSGLPFSLLGTTLAAWFSTSNSSIIIIGTLSLVQQPYAFKFLWAPLLDIPILKSFDKRRSWILLCQLLLCLGIASLALLNPAQSPQVIIVFAFILIFISASQDIAIDAYRAELLSDNERGMGATLAIIFYRLATLVSGALALIIADYWGWSSTFILIALLFMPCAYIIYRLVYRIPETPKLDSVTQAWKLALASLFKKEQAVLIMLFIFLFKLGEAFTSTSSTLVMPFLIQGLGFSLAAVGALSKGVGIIAIILGGLLAGAVLFKISLYRALMVFAVLQIITNGLFVWLAIVGKNHGLLAVCIFVDNLVAGMGMTALLAFMMGISEGPFTASHFAFYSAISALPRLISGPIGAFIQYKFGWVNLFVSAVFLAMPVILCLIKLKNPIFGTEGGTRTHTMSPSSDFESDASTSSATPARSSE